MKREATSYIVVHCSAGQPDPDVGAAEIDAMHKAKGWSRIGYHFVIKTNGQVEAGREVDAVGAHVRGHNHNSIGICLVGGTDKAGKVATNFTPDQYASLLGLISRLLTIYPGAKVVGHRDFPGVIKDCPCFDVSSFIKSYWDALTQLPPEALGNVA